MTYLTRRRPFAFDNEVERVFGDIFAAREDRPWVPTVDISETEDGFDIRAELPGVAQEDVNVTVKDNILTLKGEKRSSEKADPENYRRVESRYGSFQRSFALPKHTEADAIKADFKDGVLTLGIPKAEAAKPTEIPITVNG